MIRRAIILGTASILLAGCATQRDQKRIRSGLLTLNLRQAAFLEEWGRPDRTYITSGEEVIQAGWSSAGGGGFFKGKETFEVWLYEAKRTELVFNKRKVLAGWKGDATVKQLSAVPGK